MLTFPTKFDMVDSILSLNHNKKIIIRMLHEDLTDKILAAACEVRKRLTPGYLESIYEKALIIELTEQGLNVESQVPIQVDYKGINIGDFKIDLLVEDKIIVEGKYHTKV